MKNDRELLERASRAAGMDGRYFHSDNPIHCGIYQARGEYYWNPLISDSEALRLAVKLRMATSVEPDCVIVVTESAQEFVERGTDILAATRRAIVRAAAVQEGNIK